MALMNRSMTTDEATQIIKAVPLNLGRSFLNAAFEPRYQFVRYDAAMDRTVFCRDDTFYISEESPSDCRWMVPGLPPR